MKVRKAISTTLLSAALITAPLAVAAPASAAPVVSGPVLTCTTTTTTTVGGGCYSAPKVWRCKQVKKYGWFGPYVTKCGWS